MASLLDLLRPLAVNSSAPKVSVQSGEFDTSGNEHWDTRNDDNLHPDGVAGNIGSLMPTHNYLLGHHVNNLLQVTGNLQPPAGVSVPPDQTQANIPGGAHGAQDGNVDINVDTTNNRKKSVYDEVNGPFKTHGVVGSILGHIMDMALVSAGLHPEYTERVERQRIADAAQNYSTNPQDTVARLANAGYLDKAQELQSSLATQQNQLTLQAQRQAEADKVAALAPLVKAKAQADASSQYFSLARSASTKTARKIGDTIRNGISKTNPDLLETVPDSKDFKSDDDYAAALQQWALANPAVANLQSQIVTRATNAAAATQNADSRSRSVDISAGRAEGAAGRAASNANTRADEAAARLAETARHNKAMEKQGADNEGGRQLRAGIVNNGGWLFQIHKDGSVTKLGKAK